MSCCKIDKGMEIISITAWFSDCIVDGHDGHELCKIDSIDKGMVIIWITAWFSSCIKCYNVCHTATIDMIQAV